MFPSFGIGTTLDIFHAARNWPVIIERLKNLQIEEAMVIAVALSILADMPSGPLLLVTSRVEVISEPLPPCTTDHQGTPEN